MIMNIPFIRRLTVRPNITFASEFDLLDFDLPERPTPPIRSGEAGAVLTGTFMSRVMDYVRNSRDPVPSETWIQQAVNRVRSQRRSRRRGNRRRTVASSRPARRMDYTRNYI